jgi:predicted anti-sigma-YlaC factor YlaD
LRAGLVALAVIQLLLAVPSLVFGQEAHHMTRELGSFDFALAVGFFFVAWRPARADGMLPLMAALVLGLAIGTTVDVVQGTTTFVDESGHLLDVMGLAAVWALARAVRYPGSSGTRLATTGS